MSKPTSQTRRVEKINGVLAAVKANNWTSLNDFLYAFYSSNDPDISRQAGTCIGYKEGRTYSPEKLLDIWMQRSTSDSKPHLKEVITKKAGAILVEESSKAISDPRLRVHSTGATIPRLTTDFGLGKLAEIYQSLLPCMWLLLSMVLMAENNYERKNHRPKQNKESRAFQASSVPLGVAIQYFT